MSQHLFEMSPDVLLVPKSEEIVIEIVQDDFSQPNSGEVVIKEEIEEMNPDEEIIKVEDESGHQQQQQQQSTVASTSSHSTICNVCNCPFRYLGRHLQTHGEFNCMDCLLNFPTESLYNDHILNVHKLNPKSFTCDLCQLGFPSLKDLAVHNFKHTGTYSCPKCKFTVKGKHKHSLINHIRRHEGQFDFYCDICKQGFMSKHFLASHMEMHEGIPKYECEICKKKFTVKRYLEIHRSLNHKKELFGIDETYQCEVCGRKFSFHKSMVRHLSAIHKIGEDRTVQCKICQKVIANNHNLKKHMRVHTGEKRFCCDSCGKAFAEKKYLTKHQEAHERENQRKLQWELETVATLNEFYVCSDNTDSTN